MKEILLKLFIRKKGPLRKKRPQGQEGIAIMQMTVAPKVVMDRVPESWVSCSFSSFSLPNLMIFFKWIADFPKDTTDLLREKIVIKYGKNLGEK